MNPFILVLIFFISLSMYFSFRTVSKNLYTYEHSSAFADDSSAYMLSEFHGDNKKVLILDYVRNENDEPDNAMYYETRRDRRRRRRQERREKKARKKSNTLLLKVMLILETLLIVLILYWLVINR